MPNNTLIGALRVEASLDAGKFVDGAQKIQIASKQTESTVKSSFSGIGASLKAGIAGFVGALSVGAFTEVIQRGLEYAKSLETVSQQLGITTKDLQTLRFAAGQTGVSQEQLQTGLAFLEKSMGKAASGSKQAQDAFKAVGVSLNDINTKNRPEIFAQVADGMAKQGGAARNAAAATLIFGRSASDLNPLLDKGSAGINELSQAAEQLGIVLSDEQIKNADQTAVKLEQLKMVLEARIAGVVADNADSIYKLADSIAHLVGMLPNAIAKIKSFYAGFLDFTANVTEKFDQAVQHPLNAFNPLAAPFRGGVMHGNRVANVQSERAEAAGLRQGAHDASIRAFLSAHDDGSIRGQSSSRASDLPQFLAPASRAPRSARTRSSGGGSAPRDRSDDVTAGFAREQQQADMEILRAKQQLAGSSDERAKIELQIIQLEHDTQNDEINDRVRRAQRDFAEGKITKGALDQVEVQAQGLKAKNDQVTQIKLQAYIEQQMARQEQAQFEATDQSYGFRLDALRAADDMARTTGDHRRIQLEILDAEIEQKRLELEHQKQLAIRNGATADEIAVIQAKIDNLGAEKAQGAASIVKGTQAPLASYFDTLPQNAKEIGDALQTEAVKGIQDFNDQLVDAIVNAKSLKDVFHSVAASILQDLIKIALQEAEMALFKSIMGAAGGGSFLSSGADASFGASGVLGGGTAASMPLLPGFATGGSITVGGRSGTDRNMLSLNNMPIARVSYGERINIANDDTPMGGMGGVSLTLHNDFRGVDGESVARIQSQLDNLKAELPGRVLSTMSDAQDRFVWKAKR